MSQQNRNSWVGIICDVVRAIGIAELVSEKCKGTLSKITLFCYGWPTGGIGGWYGGYVSYRGTKSGSGKTTFISQLSKYLKQKNQTPYMINLDPAVHHVPYEVNIDIRDTINYKQVMQEYGLGPNGGIMTSLNLFTTKIDQIMDLIGNRPEISTPVLIDTPGQIEIFTWSASGQIISDSLAATYPTMLAYIIDTSRCNSPKTFMSNMLYACSILYKTKLPLLLVFNKTDLHDASFAKEWMTDFEAFQSALNKDEEDLGYMSSLINSMSLMLEEFYSHLDVGAFHLIKLVGVSSTTGEGFDQFITIMEKKRQEYINEYLPELKEAEAKHAKERAYLKGENGDNGMETLAGDIERVTM